MGSILVIFIALTALGILAALIGYAQGRLRARRIARGEAVEPEKEYTPRVDAVDSI